MTRADAEFDSVTVRGLEDRRPQRTLEGMIVVPVVGRAGHGVRVRQEPTRFQFLYAGLQRGSKSGNPRFAGDGSFHETLLHSAARTLVRFVVTSRADVGGPPAR